MTDDVPLRDHLLSVIEANDRRYEQRFTDQDHAVQVALESQHRLHLAQLDAAAKAIDKAEASQDRRLDNMNEFREQLRDQAGSFLPRLEYDRAHGELIARVEAADKGLAEKIDAITVRLERSEGRSTGLAAGWGYLAGAVALAATVIGIVLALK